MGKIFAVAAAVFALFSPPVQAAESWGLPNEEIVRFEAKVVDVLCELSGDCPAKCGGGKRQLGLVNDEGRLILPLKNQVFFAGAVDELIDFCAQRVVADGLMVTNRGNTFMALQFVRLAPDGPWKKADRFTGKWAARNGFDAKGKEAKRWFDHDPLVKDLIARQGKLGLGPAADKDFLGE